MNKRSVTITFGLALACAGAAFASDGVIEINQAAALAGGITPGDAPGFPVTLSLQGSYRLTGNLDSPIDTIAIQITSNVVTLDLGGFAVRSTNACTGYPVSSCTVENAAHGIASGAYLVTVRNGTVLGMGGTCVQLVGPSCVVDRVAALGCGGNGIYVNETARVTDSISVGNRVVGILAYDGSLVQGNEVRANGNTGLLIISYRLNGAVIENRVFDNALGGIGANGYYAKISRNIAAFNGSYQVGGYSYGDNLCNGSFC